MADLTSIINALSGYQQQQRQKSPYLNAAQLLASSPGVAANTNTDPMSAALANIARGFVTGGLSGYGETQLQNQINPAYQSVTNAILTGQPLDAGDNADLEQLAPAVGLYQAGQQQELKQILAKAAADNPDMVFMLEPIFEKLGIGGQKSGGVAVPQQAGTPVENLSIEQSQAAQEAIQQPTGAQAGISQTAAIPPISSGISPEEQHRRELYMKYGKAAPQIMQEEYSTQRKEKKEALDKLAELQGDEMLAAQNIREFENAISNAGETGGVIPGRDWLRGKALLFDKDDPESARRLAARQTLRNVVVTLAGQLKKLFPGSASDRELFYQIESIGGLGASPEENKGVLEKFKRIHEFGKQAIRFQEKAVDQGYSFAKAGLLFDKLNAMKPMFINDPQTGELKPNPDRAALDISTLNLAELERIPESVVQQRRIEFEKSLEADQAAKEGQTGLIGGTSNEGAATSLMGGETPQAETQEEFAPISSVARGTFLKTPGALVDMVTPSTYQQAFATPEQSARTVGKGAAMLAGATSGGAALGIPATAVGGPLLGVPAAGLGAVLGTAAGYLGFDSLEEAAKEGLDTITNKIDKNFGTNIGTNLGTEKTVIPTLKEVNEAFEVAGTALGVGGAFKVAGKTVSGVGRTAKKVTEIPKATAEAIKRDVLGVTKAKISQNLRKKGAKYLDGDGNEVPITDAKQYKAALEQSVDVVSKDGLFHELAASKKPAKLLVDQKTVAAGKAVDAELAAGKQALEAVREKLSPIEKNMYQLQKNPKTGEGGIMPKLGGVDGKFSDLEAVIFKYSKFKKTDPSLYRELKSKLNDVVRNWNKSKRSWEDLQDFKKDFGKEAKWESKLTAKAEIAWNEMQKDIYKVFSKKQREIYRFAMERTNPAKVNDLDTANLRFHSYKNVQDAIAGPAGKRQGLGGLIGWGKSLVSEFPANAFRAAPGEAITGLEAAGTVTGAIGKGINAPLNLAGKTLKGGARAGGVLGAELQSQNENPPPRAKPAPISPQTKGSVNDIEIDARVNDTEIDAVVKQLTANTPELAPVIKNIIRIESRGNPRAVSKSGALGIMQLMPANVRKFGVKDPFDPIQNITGGISLFNEEIARYKGDLELALAAYNAGSPKVNAAIKKKGSKDFDKIKDALPEETQAYVKDFQERGLV